MHTKYDVNNSQNPVTLNLQSANKQLTSTKLFIGDQEIFTSNNASIQHVLGSNSSLQGKTLNIFTIVKDVNAQTNQTAIRFNLDGGVGSVSWPPIIQNVQANGVAYYNIVIYFY